MVSRYGPRSRVKVEEIGQNLTHARTLFEISDLRPSASMTREALLGLSQIYTAHFFLTAKETYE